MYVCTDLQQQFANTLTDFFACTFLYVTTRRHVTTIRPPTNTELEDIFSTATGMYGVILKHVVSEWSKMLGNVDDPTIQSLIHPHSMSVA